MREAMINVIKVIPLTGFDPTIAMALAATVVKRKEMIPTIRTPINACQMFSTTPPKAKNANTAKRVMIIPKTMIFMDISSSVLSILVSLWPGFLENSPAARLTADLITPKDLMIPMMPAVAMPPIPMWRA